jgi:hypothetical protein
MLPSLETALSEILASAFFVAQVRLGGGLLSMLAPVAVLALARGMIQYVRSI